MRKQREIIFLISLFPRPRDDSISGYNYNATFFSLVDGMRHDNFSNTCDHHNGCNNNTNNTAFLPSWMGELLNKVTKMCFL